MSKIAVVLLNLGGPDHLDSVKPFLFNLFNDKAIIPLPRFPRYLLAKLISTFRNKKARGIYARMGGASPLLTNTIDQANALEAHLKNKSINAKVFVCMRYWHPLSPHVVKEVADFSPDRIILLPLYPQFSTTTTESSVMDWKKSWRDGSFKQDSLKQIETKVVGCYPIEAQLIDAFDDLAAPVIQAAMHAVSQVASLAVSPAVSTPEAQAARPFVLFSAHGLPQSVIDKGDPYQYQVEQTAERLKTKLIHQLGDIFDSVVCYQSKVGPKKWIEPATDAVVEKAAKQKRAIVVIPVAFVSDHSETVVELDQDYHNLALEHGATYYGRVPSLACHPLFIDLLSKKVEGALNNADVNVVCKEGMICLCRG